jgi:hypothetical protein
MDPQPLAFLIYTRPTRSWTDKSATIKAKGPPACLCAPEDWAEGAQGEPLMASRSVLCSQPNRPTNIPSAVGGGLSREVADAGNKKALSAPSETLLNGALLRVAAAREGGALTGRGAASNKIERDEEAAARSPQHTLRATSSGKRWRWADRAGRCRQQSGQLTTAQRELQHTLHTLRRDNVRRQSFALNQVPNERRGVRAIG